ncbi:MAG: hypothetical protein ACE5IY_08345 [bacterium]
MKIQDLYGIGPPKKPDKPVNDVRDRKVQKEESKRATSVKSDQVQISQEAHELQKSRDEFTVSKELLAKLPSSRAHVIYEALAKIKAGLYSSEKIVEEAAQKLLNSGELDDIVGL